MSSSAPALAATVDDLFAIPEHERCHEILDGELVRKAMPSGPHGRAQFRLGTQLGGPYDRRAGHGGPGGWIFASEVEIKFDARNVFRPDVAGWRRERLTLLPAETPLSMRPDWVCEILSPSNKQNDLFKKLRVYQRCEVGHYWILDPDAEALAVYRWTPDGYLLVLTAEGGERVRDEPFDGVEISVHSLIAGDDDESPSPGSAAP
ncbi:MAG: Uma2 family endonuclease [Byssovorax sp.]